MKHRWGAGALLLVALSAGLAGTAAGEAPSTPAAARTVSHHITFDRYSFLIDGKRTYLWSGEFHPYRLPSPELWPDIFQKMKAAGFNTVSIYFPGATIRRARECTTSPASAISIACSTMRAMPAST